MATIDVIINNAQAMANLKASQSEAYGGQAYNSATGNFLIKAGELGNTQINEPNVAIPSRASGIDTAVFNSMYGQIIEDLSDRYADWLSRYFPFNVNLMNAVEAKLQEMVNGGTGINAGVEAQIWQRDRDRISTEAAAASDEAIAIWASKGFALPPGAANASVASIQRKRMADVAAVSRDAAIKAFETEVENVKFAIATAIDYRTKVLNAAGDYIKSLAVAPNIASDMSTQSADAQAKLISAAASYYNARINAADLAQKAGMFNLDQEMKAALATQEGTIKMVSERVNAAVAVMQSLGQQAAASLNGLNATAQLIEAGG